jgi:hypothetical protein
MQLASVASYCEHFPTLPIFVTVMMEALGFSETSLLTRATGRNTLGDDILHSDLRENLKSYNDIIAFQKLVQYQLKFVLLDGVS